MLPPLESPKSIFCDVPKENIPRISIRNVVSIRNAPTKTIQTRPKILIILLIVLKQPPQGPYLTCVPHSNLIPNEVLPKDNGNVLGRGGTCGGVIFSVAGDLVKAEEGDIPDQTVVRITTSINVVITIIVVI